MLIKSSAISFLATSRKYRVVEYILVLAMVMDHTQQIIKSCFNQIVLRVI